MARQRGLTTLLWCLIAICVGAGLTAAITASFHAIRPEIVVETCSFVAALLLVAVERRTSNAERRRLAISRILEELLGNATALCDGAWAESIDEILKQAENEHDGLRRYYEHLSTAATSTAVLTGALGAKDDDALVRRLQAWRVTAERCNARLSMAELLLFFLPPTRDAMQERVRLHMSIAEGVIVEQRAKLRELVAFLVEQRSRGVLPAEADSYLVPIVEILDGPPGLNRRLVTASSDASNAT
jgi:hypothetical protein